MTIPNLITSIRIILVPIFAIYLIHDRFLSALVVFVLAGVSDGVDGLIARVFNQKSRLGTFLDPLADKILLVTAFVVLAVRGSVPPWLTVVVISRDVLILLGVLILFLNRHDVIIRPSILSKITTCLQLLCIFVVLAGTLFEISPQVSKGLFWGTGVLTVSSGLHYMRQWFTMMGNESLEESGRVAGERPREE
jgi:cardiolipin synthase